MPLIKSGQRVDDPFQRVGEDEALPASGDVIVPVATWQSQRDALKARDGRVGVFMKSDETPELIEDDLADLAVVALDFPAFTDGRSYSHARILRERMKYEGEIRAVGDVLLEQLHYMDRVGFDAFEVPRESAVEDWVTASKDLTVWYQPGADGRKTALQRRHGR